MRRLQALKKFHRLAQSHQVDEIMAAATSATREAENGPAFLAAIQAQTGIRPRVISGTEEARLIHMAAVYGVDIKRGKAVVIDIGGGSVEVTVGNERPQLARSFKTGVIRMTERFVKTDPLAEREERKLVRFLQSEISSFAKQVVQAGFERVIGTSGTILSLGTMAAYEMDGTEPDELRNRRIPSKQIRKLREKLTSLSLAERLRIPAWSLGAAIWRWQAASFWTPSCASWTPRTSRSATWHCAKDWCSTTSTSTAPRSRGPIAIPTSAAAASSSSANAATTSRSTRRRCRASRCRCSTRRAASTG
jgi:hypothetical protein